MRFNFVRLKQKKKSMIAAHMPQRKHLAKLRGDDRSLWRETSRLYLPSPSASEEFFFSLVKTGDVKKVKNFLKVKPDFDINCRNYQGYTALVTATMDEQLPMVEFLIKQPDIQLYDALLHAVNTDNLEILLKLLEWQEAEDPLYTFMDGVDDAATFTPDITPLMLACHNDNYEMIKALLLRNHRLREMHTPMCFCEEQCAHRLEGENLADSTARLNLFKALSSTNYICQTSEDPILTCFYLSNNAKIFAEVEHHYLEEYLKLSEDNANFATTLLNLCRTSQEVELILTAPYGNERRQHDHIFPRIVLAIDFEQKAFVAHAHTQHVMLVAWLGVWQRWRVMGIPRKTLHVLSRLLFLPLMAFVYLILPNFRCIDDWHAPINKFIAFVCSYFIFVGLLFYQDHLVANNVTRGPPLTGIEILVIIYTASYAVVCFRTLLREKYKFFHHPWNVYDLIMILLFTCTFICWLLAYLDVKRYGNKHQHRQYWSQFDWTLLAEAFFSMAFIIAFGKLLFFIQLVQQLGPLQLTLGTMIVDTVKFMVLWLAVTLSFAVGLYALYHQYIGMTRIRNGEVVKQSTCFESYAQTVASLYWAIYGYTPPDFIEVIVPGHTEVINNVNVTVYNDHAFTEHIGHTVFAIYHVCGIIILINMLVAMMSTTFAKIQDNADREWKFSRARVWSSFIGTRATMPPPFNIIPSPKQFLIWIRKRITRDPSAKFSLRILNRQLIQRYLNQHRETTEAKQATVNDIEELHHEVRELTLEKKNMLENRVMSTRMSSTSS